MYSVLELSTLTQSYILAEGQYRDIRSSVKTAHAFWHYRMMYLVKQKLNGWFRNIGGHVPERGTWQNGRIPFFSLLGYSVGFGNFTSFTERCHEYNASFLVAYLVMLLLIGIPVSFVEISLGQYVSQGPTYVFTHIAPVARGLGWGMLWVSFLTTIFYSLRLSWILYYLYSAANLNRFPWDYCNNEFNTPQCYRYCSEECDMKSTDYTNKTISSMEYFRYGLLNMNDSSKDTLGYLQPHILLCMALTWIALALCLSARLKNKERILSFIVIFPYIILGIMLLVVFRLSGNGWKIYIGQLDTQLFYNYELWKAAGLQVIFSVGIGYGGITTIASYNTLKQNTLRDGILFPLLDGATSFIAGLIIFCVLGHMAKTVGVEINEVLVVDPGFAFVIFTSAFSQMPCGWNVILTVLFLIMLFMVGFSTTFYYISTITTAIFDQFEALRNHKLVVVGFTCLTLFITCIPLGAQNGFYLFDFLKKYTDDPSLLIIVLMEVLIVCYCYGFHRFIKDVEIEMSVCIPSPVKLYLLSTLCFLTPLLLVFLLVCSIYMDVVNDCSEPSWICDYKIFAHLISYSGIFIIIAFGIYVASQKKLDSIWKPSNQFLPEFKRRMANHEENGTSTYRISKF